MRIQEILCESSAIDFNRLIPQNGVPVNDWISGLGIRTLSTRGTKSIVYSLSDDMVIKVSSDPGDCWPQFVRLCESHPQEHFPKFYWSHKGESWFMAVMERLQEMPHSYFSDGRGDGLLGFLLSLGDDDAAAFLRFPFYNETGMDYRDNIPEFKKFAAALSKHFQASEPKLADAIRLVRTLRCKPDMNPSNFMMRGKTIVITDPVNWKWPADWYPAPSKFA